MSADIVVEIVPEATVLDVGAGHEDVVFEGLRQIIWRLAPDGSIERFNAYWTEYTGLPSVIEGLAWADVFHPEDRQRLVDARGAGIASGSTYEVEARMRRADGTFRRQLCRVTPLRRGGELTGWLGTAIDVEDVRAAEDAAREAQRRKEQILESIGEGYYALDRDFRFVEVNAACERMTGRSRGELIGENLWTLFPDAPPLETYTRVPLHGALTEERYSGAAGRWVQITLYRDEYGYEAYFRDISERIDAERAVRESEARFRNMADHAPVMLWVTDAGGHCTYLSRGWYDFTGQTEAEAEGFGWLEATHPDDRARVDDAFRAAVAGQAPFRIDYRLRRRDGSYRWALDTAAPRFADDGRYLGYVGSVVDIDERREAEQQLRLSEARLKAVLDAVPVGIVLADAPTGRITGGNARVEEIFGHSILPTPDIDAHREWRSSHADGRPVEPVEYPLVRVLQGEPGFPSLEVLYHRGDGRDAWVRLIAAPIKDPSGLRGGVVACLDIDQERRVQEQLRRERDRAEGYLQVAQVVLLVLDDCGIIQTINQYGAELLGYTVEELVGQDWFAVAIPHAHQAAMRSAFGELVAGDVEHLGSYENPVVRRDGTERLVAWRNNVLRDAAGRVIGTISSGDDVTEQRAAQDRERLLAQEIDHRAKNLLAVVQSIVQLTRAGDTAGFKQAVTGRIQSLARTHGLLAATRWEGADLTQLVSEELAPFTAGDRSRVEIKGPTLKLTPSAAQALALVIHELATNAAKYGALGTEAGRVAVSWTQGPSSLDLRWIETGGPSVAAPTRQGFGSIVLRSSVERQLRGTVELDWRPEGLVCGLSVPADETVVTWGRQPAAAAAVRATEPDRPLAARPLRVLVIEDEALIAAQIEDAIVAAGHKVVGAASRIAEAYDEIHRCDPDIVVLDINVAGERSFPLAELLRARGVPFVFCSGYGASLTRPKTLSDMPVLAKPFDPADLARAIETLGAQAHSRPRDEIGR